MPGGEEQATGSPLPSSHSNHPSPANIHIGHTAPANIPVASVSPRRTPTRCQTSRGVVGVGVGVAHLSEATRERLAAASHHQQQQQHLAYIETPSMTSQHYIRQRRLSGRENPGYAQASFTPGIVEYSSLGKSKTNAETRSTTASTSTFSSGFSTGPLASSSSSSCSSSSMRYANSLDSLDAVTTSIQQARANSFNNTNGQWYQTGHANATQPIYSSSPRREPVEESRSLTYRDPSHSTVGTSRGFQRTFPLRKSTGSCTRSTTVSAVATTSTGTPGSSIVFNDSAETEKGGDQSKQIPNRNWRQSADELTEIGGMSAAFWLSPCRSSVRVTGSKSSTSEIETDNATTTFDAPFTETSIRTQSKMVSSETIATVSPFRTSRSTSRAGPVSDAETQRLRRELMQEQERVQRLSAQLSTNSHVVSAFEHSLANMTDRLTKLASTSEKKDKELSELRQIIQHLKETSELKGFPAPIRWRSDENVLSGSNNKKICGSESDNEGSNYHNNNNNNNKPDPGASLGVWRNKKQKWFRSSLTKAFGRHRHKSSGSSSSISSKDNLSKNNYQNGEQNFSTQISHQRSVSVSALDDPFVADLQRQLAVKDDLLTETRLEALSSASQLQTLREAVAKLRTELKTVQRENEDLKHRMHSSLNSVVANGESATSVIDDDKVPSSLFANMSVDRGSRDGLRVDVPVIVRIQANPQELNIRIGYVRMSRRQDWTDAKKWRELDMNVQCVFGLYMARLDPFDRLGLSAESSVERYCFMGRSRQPIHLESTECVNDDSEKRETPVLKSRQIHLTLRSRGPSDMTRVPMVLDELSFASLRPKCLLQTFTENLLRTRMGLFLGPKGCGKRFTAQRLAELLTKENSNPLSTDVCRISFNPFNENAERLEQLQEFETFVASQRGKKSMVAILENLEADDSSWTSRSLLPRIRRLIDHNFSTTSTTVYILITATRRSDILSDNSLPQATFFVSQNDCRMEKSHIGYLLRQKVIDLETDTQEANDAMIVAVNWLNRLSIHFEEFCQRIDPELHFSPKPFNHPVLENTHKFRNVERVKPNIIRLRQDRYLLNPELRNTSSPSPYAYKWEIPITYISCNDHKTISQKWLHRNDEHIELTFPSGTEWVKFNVGQYGYYRVNYPADEWLRFADLMMHDHQVFSTTDRGSLINDAFSLGESGHLDYSIPLFMTKYLKREKDLVPWRSALDKIKFLEKLLKNSNQYSSLRKYITDLVDGHYERLGWRDEGSHTDRLTRIELLSLACRNGHLHCLNQAGDLFLAWIKDKSAYIPPNLREITYRFGMMAKGDESSWTIMLDRFQAEDNAQEKNKLLYGLAWINQPWILEQFLRLAKNESIIRRQDFFTCLSYINKNPIGNPIIWKFIREEWPYLVDRFSLNDRTLGRLPKSVTSDFSSEFQLLETKDFFARYPDAGAGSRARKQALENIENNIKWLQKHQETIEIWLKTNVISS